MPTPNQAGYSVLSLLVPSFILFHREVNSYYPPAVQTTACFFFEFLMVTGLLLRPKVFVLLVNFLLVGSVQ